MRDTLVAGAVVLGWMVAYVVGLVASIHPVVQILAR